MTFDPRQGPLFQLHGARRRVRRHPVWTATVVLLAVAGIGWLWYSVFSPLFVDPEEWVAQERTFRHVLREVLTGPEGHGAPEPDLPAWPPPLDDARVRIVACADGQVARGVRFTGGYHPMDYPWGDLPAHLAASPDLVVRCLREIGLDLQQMLHIDRVRHPERYPLGIWSKPRPDPSIDHRRLPNLFTFVEAFFETEPSLTDSVDKLAAFLPGDLIFWAGRSASDYPALVGIVTDRRDATGVPRVVTVAQDDRRATDTHLLTDWHVTARFRVDRDAALERFFEANPDARLEPRPE